LQAQSLAGVAPGDIDHQAQVGADHAIAGTDVPFADLDRKLALLLGAEQGRLVDFAQIGF
jgi:hypothetical protein